MRYLLAAALTLVPAATFAQGITLFENERGSLVITNRAQFRFTYEMPDDDVQLTGTTDPGEGKGAFRIRRAKTELSGWVWKHSRARDPSGR